MLFDCKTKTSCIFKADICTEFCHFNIFLKAAVFSKLFSDLLDFNGKR